MVFILLDDYIKIAADIVFYPVKWVFSKLFKLIR